MVTVYIDELTPCLKNVETGDIIETEVLKVSRKSFLKNFNRKNGWYANWEHLSSENTIYALVIKGTTDIQGMVAVSNKENADALYVVWMVAAPHNNQEICGKNNQKYCGVGGHLFAIAIKESVRRGMGGAIYGFASDEQRLVHYQKWFGAIPLGILHKYHFMIADQAAVKIVEEYKYDWSEDEL